MTIETVESDDTVRLGDLDPQSHPQLVSADHFDNAAAVYGIGG